VNSGLGFDLFYFIFIFCFLFYFILVFILLLDLNKDYDVISYVIVTQVIKHNRSMTPVTEWSHMTQLHIAKKVVEDSGIYDII